MIKDTKRIKKAVSKALGLSSQTLDGGHRIGAAASGQAMFAYLSHWSDIPINEIADAIGCSSNTVYTLIDCARSCYATTPKFKHTMDEIRNKLGIGQLTSKNNKAKQPAKKNEKDAAYHPPFCKYTPKEECRMLDAIQDAVYFMESYGKGQQPLIEGFATIRKQS